MEYRFRNERKLRSLRRGRPKTKSWTDSRYEYPTKSGIYLTGDPYTKEVSEQRFDEIPRQFYDDYGNWAWPHYWMAIPRLPTRAALETPGRRRGGWHNYSVLEPYSSGLYLVGFLDKGVELGLYDKRANKFVSEHDFVFPDCWFPIPSLPDPDRAARLPLV